MILVTNDDGIDSPGLSALARALKAVDEVCVIAPNRNWTAAGHTSRPATAALRRDGTSLVRTREPLRPRLDRTIIRVRDPRRGNRLDAYRVA